MYRSKFPRSLFWGSVAGMVGGFQLVRGLAERFLMENTVVAVPGLIVLKGYINRGISFSLFDSSPRMIYAGAFLAFVSLGLLTRALRRKSSLSVYWGLVFLWAGGLSNLAERLFFGRVTDYLGIAFPVFSLLYINLADCALGLGVLLLGLGLWHEERRGKTLR